MPVCVRLATFFGRRATTDHAILARVAAWPARRSGFPTDARLPPLHGQRRSKLACRQTTRSAACRLRRTPARARARVAAACRPSCSRSRLPPRAGPATMSDSTSRPRTNATAPPVFDTAGVVSSWPSSPGKLTMSFAGVSGFDPARPEAQKVDVAIDAFARDVRDRSTVAGRDGRVHEWHTQRRGQREHVTRLRRRRRPRPHFRHRLRQRRRGRSPNLRVNVISRPSLDQDGALSMPNCGSTYAIVRLLISKTTMKAQVS